MKLNSVMSAATEAPQAGSEHDEGSVFADALENFDPEQLQELAHQMRCLDRPSQAWANLIAVIEDIAITKRLREGLACYAADPEQVAS